MTNFVVVIVFIHYMIFSINIQQNIHINAHPQFQNLAQKIHQLLLYSLHSFVTTIPKYVLCTVPITCKILNHFAGASIR